MSPKHWLMKAEPDSRIVKGKDVKFSVDDFESVKTTAWEGVRNAEARNLMKEMCLGDKVLFYHSNCKTPGIAALAEVTKEAYPDYTAWDSDHPYYDQKTDKENPKWYMVDVTFQSRFAHFVSLSLLKSIAGSSSDNPEEGLAYIGPEGVKAIKTMALVTRGRLSVQRVEEKTYNVLMQMGERGGWDESGPTKPGKAAAAGKKPVKKKGRKRTVAKEDEDEDQSDDGDEDAAEETRKNASEDTIPEQKNRGKKRKAAEADEDECSKPSRRSARTKR